MTVLGGRPDLGLDGRFVAFVAATMLASIAVGSVAIGLVAYAQFGRVTALADALFAALIGGAALMPLAFAIWIIPSEAVFGLTMRALLRWLRFRHAAMVAGAVTTLAASAVTGWVLSGLGRDSDGIGFAMRAVGPAAIILAPLIASRVYRPQV